MTSQPPTDSPDRQPVRAPGGRHTPLTILVWLLVVAPVALAATAIAFYERTPIVDPEAEHVATFQPEAAELSGEQEVLVSLTWGSGDFLVSPSWTGLVTAVPAKAGGTIAAYDKVAVIDGIARLAWPSAVPFHRPLQGGDRGPDVTRLQRALRDLGVFKNKPTGRVDWATMRAVGAYSRTIGFATEQRVFDPDWVVFLPSDSFDVESIDLDVGSPAPEAGAQIAEAPSPLKAARLAAAEGGKLPSPTKGWEVVLEGESYAFDQAGDISKKSLAKIETSRNWTTTGGTASGPAGGPDNSGLLGSIKALIRRVEPVRVHRVPATSVSTGSDGRYCVWRTSDGSTGTQPGAVPVYVELLPDRSQLGISLLLDLPEGVTLITNPRTALGLVSCP